MNEEIELLKRAIIDLEYLTWATGRIRGSCTIREIRMYLKENAPDVLREVEAKIAEEQGE